MSELDDLKAKMNKAASAATPQPAATPATPTTPYQVPALIPRQRQQPDTVERSPALWSRITEVVARLLAAKPPSGTTSPNQETPLFNVLVSALRDDADGSAQAHLVELLSERPALKVTTLPKVFVFDTPEDPVAAAALVSTLRHTVAMEGGHLLIWGDADAEGYRLRFSSAQPDDGAFGIVTRLELPRGFTEPLTQVFQAASYSTMEAVNERQKTWIRQALYAAVTEAEPVATRPPVQLSMAQQRSVQLVFGHAALAAAAMLPAADAALWCDKAVASYRSAQKRVNRIDPVWENGMIHRHVATALSQRAEKDAEPVPLLCDAASEWRQAIQSLTRASMPQEWAGAQIKLGNTLYRLDLLTGNSDLLREALQALQAALQVYSRTETPQKWAEIMHDLAQVLQVYGDQIKKPDVLLRAVETCEAVLNIYTRERTPLSWAAVQNTLGTALFLLDRHRGSAEHLPQAQESLESALEMFTAHGAKGSAKVAERNLEHVKKLAEKRKGHKVVDPDWSQA